MANLGLRQVRMWNSQEADQQNIGTGKVKPASGATFKAMEIVQINAGYTEAETLVNADQTRLALALEDAVDVYHRAAGVGAETSTKASLGVRGLKGKTIAICVATYTAALVNNGTSYGLKRDSGTGYPYIDQADTTNTAISIIGLVDDGSPGTTKAVDSDTNVMVLARLDDDACAIF